MFKILAWSVLVAQQAIMAHNSIFHPQQQQQQQQHRHLQDQYSPIIGYQPRSQVTDHAAIALDQALLESALANDDSLLVAQIYDRGGNSKSYARLQIPGGTPSYIAKDTVLTSTDTNGDVAIGKALEDTDAGSLTLSFRYETSNDQSNHVNCKVGAIPDDSLEQVTRGCLADGSGKVFVGGAGGPSAEFSYFYRIATANVSGRTLASLSTSAERKMATCENCPYRTFQKFQKYYKMPDYGNEWVTAAISQRSTNFPGLGNQNLGEFTKEGRIEIIKKGTAYMNLWMYVIRELEDALDKCIDGCSTDNCNDSAVHAWDQAVAYYAGSLQVGNNAGNFLYALSNKRCADFSTCGEDESFIEGTSKNNLDIIELLKAGQDNLQTGQCGTARKQKEAIENLMVVPLVQGTLRYAYKNDIQAAVNGDKELAEGSVFAASVVPLVHHCSRGDAHIIYSNMRQGFGTPDFRRVKAAFERNYKCMGITCEAVGGLYDFDSLGYLKHAGPCTDGNNNKGAIIGGVIGGIVGVLLLLCICCKCRSRAATGKDDSFVAGSNIEIDADTEDPPPVALPPIE